MTETVLVRPTLMAREIAEAPARVADQLAHNATLMASLGQRLAALDPPFIATLARGSSDHAAAFLKVLAELVAGVPVVSQAPSVGALYQRTSRHFAGAALIVVSQSGRSPDLLAATEDARSQGALVIAILNDVASPMGALADITVPVSAGPEMSVAATKSFIGTLSAMAQLVAHWAGDRLLLAALDRLPAVLAHAEALDWREALPPLTSAASLLVLGRGHTLPIAAEAALKFKETAGLHAEAFSSAEVAHGPMTLVERGSPILAFAPADAAIEGLANRLNDFAARGARIIGTGLDDAPAGTIILPTARADHPATAAIAQIQSFYPLAEALARARDRDPDHPPHLAKVTRTL